MSESKARPKLGEVQPRVEKPIDTVRRQLERMADEFAVALPQHIPVDRFKRIAITAINQSPDLLGADRKTLFAACMKAAQDGLLPDGKEGAFVVYNTKVKHPDTGKDVFIRAVQWMPMIYGVLKKIRQSGEVAKVTAHEVYEKDTFKFALGDNEVIVHEPYIGAEPPGEVVAAYCIATLKDGTVMREVMPRWALNRVRAASKSPNSPAWTNWFGEMCRKAVVRRLGKYLPTSTDIEKMLNRADVAAAAADTIVAQPEGTTIDGEADAEDGVIISGSDPEPEREEQQGPQGEPEQRQIQHEDNSVLQQTMESLRQMGPDPEPAMIDRGEPPPAEERQEAKTAETKTNKKQQGKFF